MGRPGQLKRRRRYRHLRRTFLAIGLLGIGLVLVLVSVAALASTDWAQQRIARRLESIAADAGIGLQIDRARLGLLSPRLEMDGVLLSGPLLSGRIEHLDIALASFDLAEGRIRLSRVAAADVDLEVGDLDRSLFADRGERVLDLGIDRVDLRRVRLAGHSKKVDIELAGLQAQLEHGVRGPRGWLKVVRMSLDIGNLETIIARVDLRGRLGESPRVDMLRVEGDELELIASGMPHALDFRLDLGLLELDRLMRGKGLFRSGEVHAEGRVDLAEASMSVVVESDGLQVLNYPTGALRGRMDIDASGLDAVVELLEFSGGVVEGTYSLTPLGPPFAHRIRGIAEGVDVETFLGLLNIAPVGIDSRLDTEIELDWNGRSFPVGTGIGHATLVGGDTSLGVDGQLVVHHDGAGGLVFEGPELSFGGADLSWFGRVAFVPLWAPDWRFDLATIPLDLMRPVVDGWVAEGALPQWVQGSVAARIGLSGRSFHQLTVDLELDSQSPSVLGRRFDQVLARVSFAENKAYIESLQSLVDGGHIEALGVVELDSDGRVDLEVRSAGLPLGTLVPELEDSGFSAKVAAVGRLGGQVRDPHGSFAIGLRRTSVLGIDLGDGSGSLEISGGHLALRDLELERGLGGRIEIEFDGSAGDIDLFWDDVGASGCDLLVCRAVQTARLAAGVDLEAGFRCLWDEAGLQSLSAYLAGGSVDLAAEVEEGRLRAFGSAPGGLQLSLGGVVDGGRVEAVGRIELEAVETWLAAAGRELPLAGRMAADVRGQWRVADAIDGLELQALVEPTQLRLASAALVAARPLPLNADAAGLEILLDGLEIGGRPSSGRLAIGLDGSLGGHLELDLPMATFRGLLPGRVQSGRVRADIELDGRIDDPAAHGSWSLEDGRWQLSDSLSAQSLEARGAIEGQLFRIAELEAKIADGRIKGSGAIDFDTASLDLDLDLDGARLEVLAGLTAVFDGELRLGPSLTEPTLSGELSVRRSRLDPTRDPVQLLALWLADAPQRPATGLALDLHVLAPGTVVAETPTLDLHASAELKIEGDFARPGAIGFITLDADATAQLRGVRYEVERGRIDLLGVGSEPLLDLVAVTQIDPYRVEIRMVGPIDQLEPVFLSDPPLPAPEIVALLSFGHRSSGSTDEALASALLAGQLSAELEKRARSVLGVDQVVVDPFAETTGGEASPRLTLIKQVSPTWTVLVQSNLSSNREEVVSSRWRLAPGIYLEASRDIDGSYALDIKLRRRY